jgi:hypothetical protein
MPTKPLERLLFVQGGNCFFCRKSLSRADASVEHLIALTHGGKDGDENCVACCKALNMLFGRMSLKEKLAIVLNQTGDFKCPASTSTTPSASKASCVVDKATRQGTKTHAERFALVIADLQKRGNAKPRTVEKLLNTIRNQLVQLGESGEEANALFTELTAKGYASVAEEKVTYALPPKDALCP